MSIEIIEMLIPKSNKFTRPGTKRKPRSITIHETDNTNVRANASAHARLQQNGNRRQASWHLQVDDEKQVYLSVPYDEVAYAAGDGKGPGNSYSIHIEICVNKDGNYKVAVGNAIKLVKYLLDKYPSIKQVDVVQHNKWSGKNCPRHLRAGDWGINWNDFLTGVKVTEKVEVEKEEKEYTTTNTNFNIGDKVRIKKTAKTYATGQTIPSSIKGKTDAIMQRGSNRMLLKGIYSWVRTSDLELVEQNNSKPSKPKSKSIDQLANEVINGLHGDGAARKKSLGSKFSDVQKRVNEILLSGNKVTSKPKPATFKVGSKVKIKSSAGKYSRANVNIPAKHKNKSYTIQQVSKNDVLIEELYSWVKKSDLQ